MDKHRLSEMREEQLNRMQEPDKKEKALKRMQEPDKKEKALKRMQEPDKKEKTLKRMQELDKKERALKRLQEELENRERMFHMQWKLLEHELSLFAKEKEEFDREKKRHKYKAKLEQEKRFFSDGTRINAGMYFLGVHDELSLKKRYRDLLKLFHPDSMNGDVDAMQAINKEYSELKRKYEEMD